MVVYTLLAAVAGVVLGIFFALSSKKSVISYGSLDRAGRYTNIIMLMIYVTTAPAYIFLGAICEPYQEGFLGVLGWIIAVVCASPPLFCGLGLGLSVSLRKAGKSKTSFAVQFIGALSIALSVILYAVFVGSLLAPIN